MSEDTDARRPARPDGIGASFQGALKAMGAQELTLSIDAAEPSGGRREKPEGAEQDLLSVRSNQADRVKTPGDWIPTRPGAA